MTGTIFDLIQDEPLPGKEGYFQLAEKAPKPKDNSFFNTVKDYAKTALKGSAEGLSRLGQAMGPLEEHPKIKEGKFEPGRSKSQQLEQQTETLDALLPTDEGYVQSSLRRGLREVPTVLAMPGSSLATLPRAIAAGFLGEGAKELGAPEWAQTAAELTAYIGPDITKKLLSTGKNKELIDAAKKLGISDEALTPLLQSEFKQKWLTKLSPRRGATQKALEKSKGELGEAYTSIQKSPEALGQLGTEESVGLIDKIDKALFDMPSGVRDKIKQDLKDFYGKEITGDSIINLWKDINHNLGPNSKQLSLLKEPLKQALQQVSPEMAKDFGVINDLFSKYYKISKRLEPNLMTDIIGASEALGFLASLTTGYYPVLFKIAGEKTARKLAQQMLINPRFQQISNKMVEAINQNKLPIAKKLSDLFAHEVRKTSPEMAETLENISNEDLMELFKLQQKTEE